MTPGLPQRLSRAMGPWVGVLLFVLLWQATLALGDVPWMPGPWQVVLGLGELVRRGVLFKHLVASLFRVTWGLLLAGAVALPLGLWLGWSPTARRALSPFVHLLRPLSPLAWVPVSILWWGVGDASSIFILFIATAPSLTLVTLNAVRHVPRVYVNAGLNFGLTPWRLLPRVVLPAALPELLSGLRLTLGLAWLVVVAAEMLAVNSGLGYLLVDSRNAGNRYDLVVAGMVCIGLSGLALDTLMAHLTRSALRHQELGGEERA